MGALTGILVGVLLAGAGCGVVGEPEELTQAQVLAKIAGHRLTPAEEEEQLRLADLLCGFDRRVLQHIWADLDAGQLEFQDWVFGQHCPERSPVYTSVRTELGAVPEDERLVLDIPAGVDRLPRTAVDTDTERDTDSERDTDTDDD